MSSTTCVTWDELTIVKLSDMGLAELSGRSGLSLIFFFLMLQMNRSLMHLIFVSVRFTLYGCAMHVCLLCVGHALDCLRSQELALQGCTNKLGLVVFLGGRTVQY